MNASRSRRIFSIGAATLLHSVSVLALQILALVALTPSAFGRFSALYLFFALSSSVLLSVVCEAWQRKMPHAEWREYSAALTWISLLSAALTVALCQFIPGFQSISYLGGIAIGFATYRTGARYYALQQHQLQWVLPGDLGGALILAAGWVVFLTADFGSDLSQGVVLLWAVSAFLSAALSKPPTSIRLSAIRWWLRRHRIEIRTLLGDSVLLDASAIGTPYALMPILGIPGFGIYRALSNVSGPVKLLLFPLRPLFSSYTISQFARPLMLAIMLSVGTAIGAICYACLVLIAALQLELGTLTALIQYAMPAAIFVSATFLNGVFYLVGRTHFSGRSLFAGRISTSLLGILFPLVGALINGLDGAIWCITFATLLCALIWMLLSVLESKKVTSICASATAADRNRVNEGG